jgi:hypothetical protein
MSKNTAKPLNSKCLESRYQASICLTSNYPFFHQLKCGVELKYQCNVMTQTLIIYGVK